MYLLFCSMLFGQNNALRITVNGFTNFSREEVTVDTSFNISSSPRKEGGFTNYNDLSLSYLRKIGNLSLFGGVGIERLKDDFSSEIIGFSQKRLTKIESFNSEIKFHFGLLHNVLTTNRFDFFLGIGTKFDYRISKKSATKRSFLDIGGGFLEGEELHFDFAKSWSFGPTLEVGCYYRFVGEFYLGINFTPWFFIQKEKGNEEIEIIQFGHNKSILSQSGFSEIVNKTLFSRSQTFSYSLLWKF